MFVLKENISTDYLYKKDQKLDDFLKNVYVTSSDPAPPLERKIDPNRPLPLKRTSDMGMTYGYSESEEVNVPEGKVSLKQAVEFITNHQNDPKKYSSTAIASQYKLSPAATSDILEHFKLFIVKMPKKDVDPSTLSAYEKLQLKVKNMTIASGPGVIKEMGKLMKNNTVKEDEKSEVGKGQEKKDLQPENNIDVKNKNVFQTEVNKEKAQEKKEVKTEQISDTSPEERSLNPKKSFKKGSIRKNQENG